MNIFNIVIDGKTFTPKSEQVFENIRLKKELNDFGITLNGIVESDLALFDTEKVLFFNKNNKTTPYIIVDVQKPLIARASNIYRVDIIAHEYTKKLQDDIIIGKGFRQPNDRSLTRYTTIEVVDRLLFDSILWENTTKYKVDADSRILLDSRSPDFSFKDRTLFECLVEIGESIDAIPVLTIDENGIDVLSFRELNKRRNDLVSVDTFRNLLIKKNAEDGQNTIYTRAENVFDTTVAGITHYPSSETYTSFRTDLALIKKDEKAFVPTGKLVQDLIDIRIKPLSAMPDNIAVQGEYTFSGGSGSAVVRKSDLLNEGISEDYSISLIKNTIEKKAYDVLDEAHGRVSVGVTKANTFFFTQGQPNIFGVEIFDRGIFLTNTDTLENWITSAMMNDDVFKQAMLDAHNRAGVVINDINSIHYSVTNSLNDDMFIDCELQVEFKTSENVTAFTTKSFIENDLKEPSQIKIVNQQGRTIDIEKLSFANLGVIQRLDVEEILKDVIHESIDDVYEVGDFVTNEIITLASYIYRTNSVDGKYEFDENHNKLGIRVDVDSELRTTNIVADDVIESPKIKRFQMTLEESTNVFLSEQDQIFGVWANEYFYDSNNKGILSMSYTAIRTGKTFDGKTKYTNAGSIQGDQTGTGRSQGLMTLNPRVIGRSIILTGKWENILEISKTVNTDRTITPRYHSYLGTDARYQGEFEEADFRIGYGEINIPSSLISPFITYAPLNENDVVVIQNSRIIGSQKVFKDKSESVIQQIEIELKTNNRDAIIYPAFNKTHRAIEPNLTSVYVARFLSEPVTLSNKNRSSVTEGGVFSITFRENIQNGGTKLRVANNGSPFFIYNSSNGELIYANNKPINTTGDTVIRYKMKNINKEE